MAPAVSEVRIKRVDDPPDKDDGSRVLVNRLPVVAAGGLGDDADLVTLLSLGVQARKLVTA